MGPKLILSVAFQAAIVANALAQGPIAHQQIDRRLDLITSGLERLTGQQEYTDRSLQLIAAKVSKNDIEWALAFAQRPNVANPKATFERMLLQMICDNYDEDCETRSRVEAIEQEVAIHKRRLEELAGNQHSVLKPVTPATQSPVLTQQTDWVVHRIVSSRSRICPNATLVAKCINHRLADGRVYHGDLYVDCSGVQVLVPHRRTTR